MACHRAVAEALGAYIDAADFTLPPGNAWFIFIINTA
jgi:hypothetical protein